MSKNRIILKLRQLNREKKTKSKDNKNGCERVDKLPFFGIFLNLLTEFLSGLLATCGLVGAVAEVRRTGSPAADIRIAVMPRYT